MIIGLQQLVTKILILLEFLPVNEDSFSLYTSRYLLNPAETIQTLHRLASFPNYNVHLKTIPNLNVPFSCTRERVDHQRENNVQRQRFRELCARSRCLVPKIYLILPKIR